MLFSSGIGTNKMKPLFHIMRMLIASAIHSFTYRHRVVARYDAPGITISTAFTFDEGYETVLIDAVGSHPVQRYANRRTAFIGHGSWVAFVLSTEAGALTEVIQVGACNGTLTDDTIVTLVPKGEN